MFMESRYGPCMTPQRDAVPAAPAPPQRKRRVPQQSRSRDRVARLLDAASALVVTEGVDDLGTRGIAEAAGVPVASLYQYFADKEDILLALVERDIEEMDERVAAALTDLAEQGKATVPAIVAATMAAFVSVYRERPAFVVIWLRGRANQAVRDFGREHNRRVAARLHAFAADLGLLAPGTPVRVAEVAVEIGDRLFQLAFEKDLTGDADLLHEAQSAVTAYLDLHAADEEQP
jgi:AcrR family transcriptional regulator